ncbi:acetyl-CoA carboxylase biotin carboxylase subunit [Pollutimonas nitritireducens]|uniref:Acetyl-CoA carboxylase biotin carboxylase subunit n=1 Tax=Pollutimonas nitritireducens TaxID=2045209 RepID=A0A2N4UJX7_9BURK|nr:biotin carboxylase N-terminal domain-containing protein [Pollutimonas nitritireducens]PLC55310.1 acetyl-CoA carboxylase biotin carboxylase subunit [Pollutimonas nitritireducens]
MLKKILIANRGEIACRVIRACRKLGVASVAVYSDADAASPHVRMADESVHIGPSRSTLSYLDGAKILDAARQTGADAVHPGYGFLAENYDFAAAVISDGLAWIGPRPESIQAMGHKQNARDLAIRAGVPVVPGTGRMDASNPEVLLAEAERIGFPLLVKAAAGGGGIGMRQVFEPSKLVEAAAATQSQAKAAFGSDHIFLERFIPCARHVEVQVFGFDTTAVHMYERDCSLQRRFQKIIEEAPAPDIPMEVRQEMQKAAINLAVSVGYQGAGTVEFIFDVNTGEFFFLEMNTRIQVEHPVTEMITGLDLVAMQLQYAGGELQAMTQDEIQQSGHAIECRLYAENPEKNFMPSPGKLSLFDLAEVDSERIRIETGYEQGGEITPFYDPMIAKIIAYGADRADAIEAMLGALAKVRVQGIKTNLDFLISCMEHTAFRSGQVSTGFVEEHKSTLLQAQSKVA